MNKPQTGILEATTPQARFLVFGIKQTEQIAQCLNSLNDNYESLNIVIGIGLSLANALNKNIEGLSSFPVLGSNGIDIPSTPAALWCWCRGTDRGELFHNSREIESLLLPAFELVDVVDSFQFREGRDMSGYVDGTENPTDDDAVKAAIVASSNSGMNGSSFVAVQQWLHDFDVIDEMSVKERDNAIGRRISDNEEMDDAPPTAHVKRTAQETFEPEAFIVRRSMPWASEMTTGLNFIAFGCSFDAFEAQMKRMLGIDDNIVDGIFAFTRPVTGYYFWCPPMAGNKLDLSVFGL